MATERIEIIVSERGTRTVRRNIEDIGGGAKGAESAVTLLNRALGLLGGALALDKLIRMADTFTNIQNRLKLVTTGTENLARVTDELFNVANRTRSSYESTAELYTRVAQASKDLGRSQEELLQFTESLNQAVILSGASAEEASAGIIQLSQGIASGALQGDELRSVLEQLPAVADVIAKSLGVTRGELRAMGKEGKITAQVVLDAFKQAREELDGKFAQTVPTIGQSFTVLQNNAMRLWGEFTTGSGIAQGLAQALLLVANNLDRIIPLAIGVGVAFAGWSIASTIAGILGPMIALERALGATSVASALTSISLKALQGSINGITMAIAANPLGALAVALTALITLFVAFGDDIKVTEDGLVSLKDVAVAAMQLIWESVQGVVAVFQTAWDAAMQVVGALFKWLGTTAGEVFAAIGAAAKALINAYIGVWVLAFRTIGLIWNNFPGFMNQLFTTVVNLGAAAAEMLLNAWQVPLKFISRGLSIISDDAGKALEGFLSSTQITIPRAQANAAGQQFATDFGQAFDQSFGKDYVGDAFNAVMDRARQNALADQNKPQGALNGPGQDLSKTLDDAEKKTKKLKDAEAEAQKALQAWLQDIDREIELLGLSNRERERAQELYRLEDAMKRKLTDSERQLANARIDSLQAARDSKYLRDYVQDLEDENSLLASTGREHNMRAELLKIERDLGRDLTATEREWLSALIATNETLRGQNDLLEATVGKRQEFADKVKDAAALLNNPDSGFTQNDAFDQLIGGGDLAQFFSGTQAALDAQLAQYQTYYDQIKQMRDQRLIDEQSAATALNNIEISMMEARLQKQRDFFGTLAVLSKSKNRELAAIGKAAAITQATIDGYAAVQRTLREYPAPFNFIAAAAVGAATAANVAGILSQNANFMTGGSFKVGGSGGPDSQMVAFRASPGEQVNISTPAQVRKGTGSMQQGDGGGGGAQVNQRIVNVLDPALIGDFLETPEGEQVLVNVMRRNGDAVRSISQGG